MLLASFVASFARRLVLSSQNFFKKISTLKLPWSRILEYSWQGSSKADISSALKRRHEVGDWRFPELTEQEEEGRREIVDVLNRCN